MNRLNIAFAVILLSASRLLSAEIVMLGINRIPRAISDDGRIVVGGRLDVAFGWQWQVDMGFSLVAPLPDQGDDRVWPQDLSADGRVIGGISGGIPTRWIDGRPFAIDALPDAESTFSFMDLSADGNVLVGAYSSQEFRRGFRWSSDEGTDRLEPLTGYNRGVTIYGVSGDGSVVVGTSRKLQSVNHDFEGEATMWTRRNGEFQPIGLGRPDGLSSYAAAVSRDGSTIIGGIGPNGGHHARWPFGHEEPFRWTNETGIIPLGQLEGTSANTPIAISADAAVVVGNTDINSQSFVWDIRIGMRVLQTVLEEDHGVSETSGQYEVRINALSADARTIAGEIRECETCDFQGWALFLDRPLVATSGVPGDFNNSSDLDTEDLDILAIELKSDRNLELFDLNGDNVVNAEDRRFWVHDLAGTFFGDANLDGEFNSRDLVAIFRAGEYEDAIELNSSWATGDWNGDRDFTSSDLVAAFEDGGYEQGPRPAVSVVPEPAGLPFVFPTLVALCAGRRQSRWLTFISASNEGSVGCAGRCEQGT